MLSVWIICQWWHVRFDININKICLIYMLTIQEFFLDWFQWQYALFYIRDLICFCFISVLTKDEKGLECVKHALNLGYSEKKIKQALLKLRVKGTENQFLTIRACVRQLICQFSIVLDIYYIHRKQGSFSK